MSAAGRGPRTLSLLIGALLAVACDARVTSIGAQLPDAAAPDAAARDANLPDAAAPATGFYLEAEDGELSGGFGIGEDAAASNAQYLIPPAGMTSDSEPGPARARYALTITTAGSYVIWGRIWAPDADTNRFWFQLDGGEWHKWRISVGDIWYWDDLHEDAEYANALRFELTAGAHELVIANWVEGARLDRLYVTADGDEPPGNATPCHPPHSIERNGECLPSCGILKGTRCGDACAGREPLPAYDCDVCCRVEP